MSNIFTLYIYWNPSPYLFSWYIPFLNRPILWYGLLFALGFFLGLMIFQHLVQEFLSPYRVPKKEILRFSEAFSFHVVLGTLIGARLGDVLFYQSLSSYVHDPFSILKFWEGGLSSHGAVIGILCSLFFLYRRMFKKYPMLNFVAMLDLLAIPALLAAAFIRIGNFFNQEILGIATKRSWAVIFGSPADGIEVLPRHPVQLYEALFYLFFFGLLWLLRARSTTIYRLGKTSGLCFMGTFTFRFFIEFLKVKQSALIEETALLDMGQLLSIPLVFLGVFLFFREQKIFRVRSIKGN